jgi:two-component sensor histidine kinase
MHTNLANVVMSASTAVPLGLLVNEFVTNSLKYAFGDSAGVISVELAPVDDGRLRLSLCDNGRGLLPATDPAPGSSGTGIRIIEGLARQIGGRPQWKSDGGTSLTVEFPAARAVR